MICPECGSEYRDGFTRCADCDVDLVEPSPGEAEEPDVALVKVYETVDAALIPLLKSVLDDAEIPYMARGEAVQDFFGGGRLFGGSVVGPVELWVREDDEAEARAILDTLET